MKRKREQKKIRGVFERPSGSNVWWIDYWDHGIRHREKIGRKSDAIDAYRDRKTAIRRGEKLPTLRRIAPVTISDLVDLVLDYVRTHGHKDQRTYQSRGNLIRNGRRDAKGTLIHKGLGDRNAETLTSEDIEAWLGKNCKTPATFKPLQSAAVPSLQTRCPEQRGHTQPC